MDTPYGAPPAGQLTSIPVITDADVLARVDELIEPTARRGRELWLFFFYPDGTQAPVIVPLHGLPELPGEDDGDVPFGLMRHFYGLEDAGPDLSFILTLVRDGTTKLTEGDRQWLGLLQRGIDKHAAPVRMICLATPEGVRGLGPRQPGPTGPA